MHIVEELLALFGTDEDVLGDKQTEHVEPKDDNLCVLSIHAVAGLDGPGVMQLHAWLHGREVLLLVDSGSTSSFVDQHLAARLQGVIPLSKPCRVKVADGALLLCNTFIPQCQWTCQGQEFNTDFKIISLGVYEVILGMDWLKKHSPMYIDWEAHDLSVTTSAGPVELQAVAKDVQQCLVISSQELMNSCKQGSVAYVVHLNAVTDQTVADNTIPIEILRVLEQYTDVFEEPRGLPPRRACDHRIPLMEGAQLVNLRLYRHKPELKTEIERQVKELLDAGVIHKSSSPFSSSALLVKKKDGT